MLDLNLIWAVGSTLLVGSFLFTIWLVRLESKVKVSDKNISILFKNWEKIESEVCELDERVIAQLSSVRESLARIEGLLQHHWDKDRG